MILPGQITEEGITLLSAHSPSGAGSLLAFRARTGAGLNEGVYVRTRQGTIKRILGPGDTVEGLIVDFVNATAGHDSVALLIHSNISPVRLEIIFRASFPAPAPATTEIPALDEIGLVFLALALAVAGLGLLGRSA